MQVLVLIEDRKVQTKVLKILKIQKQFNTRCYNPKIGPADQIPGNTSVIITEAGAIDKEKQELVGMFQNASTTIQVVVFGEKIHSANILQWLCNGADAGLFKDELKDNLLPIILQLRPELSMPVLSRGLLSTLQNNNKVKPLSTDRLLTPREKQVLQVITRGNNYKMAGNKLNISRETVRAHIKNIYKKLKVNSLTEMVAKAITDNLV